MSFKEWLPRRHRDAQPRSEDPASSFRRELYRLFDDFVTEPFGPTTKGEFSPTLDVSETDSAIEIKAELPGVDEKDLELLLEPDSLTIRGEKKDESDKTEDGVRIRESSYGRFERVVPLSREVETDKAKARYKKGVLRVTLPTTESAKRARTKIPVTN